MNADYVVCISAMLKQQQKHYMCHDYRDDVHDIVAWRSKICNWIFQTADHLALRTETAIVAVNYLDRFLCSDISSKAKTARCDRMEYQLVALTCLFVSVKINDSVNVEETMSLILSSSGLYTASDLRQCEEAILQGLQWRMQGPTACIFVMCLLDLVPDSVKTDELMAKMYADTIQQIKLATGDYACIILRPSCLAIASLLNVLEGVTEEDFPSASRREFFYKVSNAFHVEVTSKLMNAIKMRLNVLDLHRSAE